MTDTPSPGAADTARPRIGRAPATTHGELSHVAFTLFIQRGFDATTIEDIASAAGIGRRTFFRYFASKNDLPWGDFDTLLRAMHDHLGQIPDAVPLAEALRLAVLEFNRFPAAELPYHRDRMRLLLTVPTLLAHSTLRYAAWRQVVADFVAHRQGADVDSLGPQTIAWVCLGLCLAAYEQWLAHEEADLEPLLGRAFEQLDEVFGPVG